MTFAGTFEPRVGKNELTKKVERRSVRSLGFLENGTSHGNGRIKATDYLVYMF